MRQMAEYTCGFCGIRFMRSPYYVKYKNTFCSWSCQHRYSSRQAEARRVELFWSKVKKTDGCWEWTGRVDHGGYGQGIGHIGWSEKAHQYSFRLAHGRKPNGYVLHHCDNRRCVRPDHLYEGTAQQNVTDMITRNPNASANKHRKLDTPTALCLRSKLQKKEMSWAEASEEYGVSQAIIARILNGQHWTIRDAQNPT